MDAFAMKGLDDLVLLDEITEEKVFERLKARLTAESQMYTFTGPVLIAMNPYRLLKLANGKSLYDESVMDSYRGKAYYEVAPSVFAIAEASYSSMVRFQTPAAVIISGESGSGKTESARQVLAFLARASLTALAHNKSAASQVERAVQVKDRLITSTLITEAFGNAQTLRNDNSSRFGKLMAVRFTSSGIATGSDVKVYLLERQRVVAQQEGERGFHCNYYLVAGASPDLKRTLKITTGAEGFRYLSNEYRRIPGVDDGVQFRAVQHCMKVLGIPDDKQEQIWKTLACVLHLGNVKFSSPDGDDAEETETADAAADDELVARAAGAASGGKGGASLNGDAAHFSDDAVSVTAVDAVCALLGVDKAKLEAALTKRSIVINGSTTVALNTKVKAQAARDSLAKALYERLFLAVVGQINASITFPDEPEEPNTLSILDLYGFEVLATNRFDQFNINFVNERLHQLFLERILRAEQAEYESEGIAWTPVDYFDNLVVIGLVDQLYQLLDDMTNLSNQDAKFEARLLQGMNQKASKHEHYLASRVNDGTFTVRHYAGDVMYNVNGMVTSNRDQLSTDLVSLMTGSKGVPLVVDLFADKRTVDEKSKKPPTSSQLFRNSVAALIDVLSAAEPFYIRCIKPNDKKQALAVDDDRLLHQVQYLGLVETTRVKRAGFAYRATYDEFLRRYATLSSSTWPDCQKSAEEAVKEMITSINVWVPPKPKEAVVKPGAARPGAPRPRPGASVRPGAGRGVIVPGRAAAAGVAMGGAGTGNPTAAALLGAGRPAAAGGAAKPSVAKAAGAAGAASGGKPAAATAGGAAKPAVAAAGGGVKPAAAAAGGAAKPAAGKAGVKPVEEEPKQPAFELPAEFRAAGNKVMPGDLALPGSYKLTEGADLQFGASKIFLKEPRTLFALEYMRYCGLGRVICKIQSVWRAYDGKRRYKKMKQQMLLLQAYVRGFFLRQQFLKMRKAAVKLQAIVRGYLVRAHAAADLRQSLGLIKSLGGKPRRRLSINWEIPKGEDWLGFFMPNSKTPSPGAAAMCAAMSHLHPPQKPEDVVYCDHVLKIKQNYSLVPRSLWVTSAFLMNVHDPWQKGRINRAIPLANISAVSMSPYRDSYLVFHVKGERDYIAICETKVHLLQALNAKYTALTGAPLPLNVVTAVDYKAFNHDDGAKLRHLTFATVPSDTASGVLASDNATTSWRTSTLGDRFKFLTGAPDDTSAAGVAAAFKAAEKVQPVHVVGGDKHSMAVTVPIPPKLRLRDLLTPAEAEALKRKGYRIPA